MEGERKSGRGGRGGRGGGGQGSREMGNNRNKNNNRVGVNRGNDNSGGGVRGRGTSNSTTTTTRNRNSWRRTERTVVSSSASSAGGSGGQMSKRDEAIQHKYRKMMRRAGPGPNGPFQSHQPPPQQSKGPGGASQPNPKASLLLKPHYLFTNIEETEAKDQHQKPGHPENSPRNKKTNLRPSSFQRAKQDFDQKKELARQKLFQRQQFEEERNKAIKERKEKRFRRNKLVNQKNAKGQPVFKGQIQLILDKLQAQIK